MLEAVRNYFKGVMKSVGVVFGDIGTSPMYTLGAIFSFLHPTVDNVIGVLSLIIWTLIIVVTIGYAWLAMSLGKKGEGGTIVLRELLMPLLTKPWQKMVVLIFSFVGVSLFIGDGVITPAVTILGAVEGVPQIPGCRDVSQGALILIACVITILLFILQRRGTEFLSRWFGIVMTVWFVFLAISGLWALAGNPSVLIAFNPYYAIRFLMHNSFKAFAVLSSVILCATGGEALYADMGHLGRKPIVRAWYLVLGSLLLSYFGQGAFLLANPKANKVLYEMVFSQVPDLYIPFLILCVLASIIASQSLISGVFSAVYQGIMTNIIPRLKISYTSSKLRSQIYISTVNWMLLISVLFMILEFRTVDNLTAAYGFAASGTMLFTGIVMMIIFWLRRVWIYLGFAILVTGIDLMFFIANTTKIQQGAYWSIIVALIPLSIILIYYFGERRFIAAQKPLALDLFTQRFKTVFDQSTQHIEGTALYFVRDVRAVPQYVVHTVCDTEIMYEDTILFSVQTRDDPFGVIGFFKSTNVPGLRIFELQLGYMEVLDIERILKNAGVNAKVMFYGVDAISAKSMLGKVYALMKRLSSSFVHFHKLPAEKLHGVIRMIEI